MATEELVRKVKSNSSLWMHEALGNRDFAWQTGYGAFSVTGKKFVGREPELHLLDEAWGRSKKEDKINIVSLIGQGGEGKSALVLEWQARRARHQIPRRVLFTKPLELGILLVEYRSDAPQEVPAR